MSTFAVMLPGFATLAAKLTGLPLVQVVNAHMPAKAIDPTKKGRLEFRVIACKSVNETSDEIRYDYVQSDPATHSQVRVALSLDAATTVAAGKQMSVGGDPIFELVGSEEVAGTVVPGDVVSTTAGDYFARFRSVDTGPIAALAGTLTTIETPVTGWTAGTNPLAATLGADAQFELRMTSQSMRLLTIQVKFLGYDNTPGRDALYYLERLGNRMIWPSSIAALKALEMGLVARHSFLDLSKVMSAEDRQWSVGVKDFLFNVVVNETPETGDDNPADWIQTVHFYSNNLVNPDDSPANPQISGSVTRP